MVPKIKIHPSVKKWAPIAGVELTGGYASNWAYDKHVQNKGRAMTKGRQTTKPYPSA